MTEGPQAHTSAGQNGDGALQLSQHQSSEPLSMPLQWRVDAAAVETSARADKRRTIVNAVVGVYICMESSTQEIGNEDMKRRRGEEEDFSSDEG
jgi:hypothetical protein